MGNHQPPAGMFFQTGYPDLVVQVEISWNITYFQQEIHYVSCHISRTNHEKSAQDLRGTRDRLSHWPGDCVQRVAARSGGGATPSVMKHGWEIIINLLDSWILIYFNGIKKIELNADFFWAMFDDTTWILDMAGIIPAVWNCGVVDIGIISVICLCVGTIISIIRLILELWRSESSELFSTVKLGWFDWLSHIWERLKPPPRRVLPWRSFGVWCHHKLQRLGEWLAWRAKWPPPSSDPVLDAAVASLVGDALALQEPFGWQQRALWAVDPKCPEPRSIKIHGASRGLVFTSPSRA